MGKPIAKKEKGAKKSKAKGRKIGRNKVKCATYLARGTRLRNKLRRVALHLRHNPTDKGAEVALTWLRTLPYSHRRARGATR